MVNGTEKGKRKGLCGAEERTYVQAGRITVQDTGEVQLLHLLLQPTGQARVHAGTSREDYVLIQVSTDVHSSGLDRVEKHFCERVS